MTQKIISECDNILNELCKFSDTTLFLGDPISDNRLLEFESKIGFELPVDFKYILSIHNSFSLSGTEVFGVDKRFGGSSLENVYDLEHLEVDNPLLKEFLPFSPDGFGNHYCLDLSRLDNYLCPVVFWQHDYIYVDKDDVETCSTSFIEWVKEVMIN